MSAWEIVGGLGVACFFSRWIVQWLQSERQKESAAPALFFWLSLVASVLLFAYTLSKGELVLLSGYVANSIFYVRNLILLRRPGRESTPGVAGALLVLFAVLGAGVAGGWNEASSGLWLVCGILGQTAQGGRFALQWWLSEKKGVSHFPVAFWWISLAGSLLMLAYSWQTADAIWIVSYVTAWIMPIRNLMLSRGRKEARSPSGVAA